MCLIVYKPKDKKFPSNLLRGAIKRNNDGFGIMAVVDGKVIVIKSPTSNADFIIENWEKFNDYEAAIHLRYKTHGQQDRDNTHPMQFISPNGFIWLMHNGVFNSADVPQPNKNYSDTWHFLNHLVAPLFATHPSVLHAPGFAPFIENIMGYTNKVLTLDSSLRFKIFNKKAGKEHSSGCWISNEYSVTENFQNETGGYGGYNTHWKNGAGYKYPVTKPDEVTYYTTSCKEVKVKLKK